MILLEGKPIAEKIRNRLKAEIAFRPDPPRLAIVMVGNNRVSETFVKLKEKFAAHVGAQTRRYEFDEHVTTRELRSRMKDIVHEAHNDGVIVQLPLPHSLDAQGVLNAIVPEKDVDMLSARAVGDFQVGKEKILPPVVAALEALFSEYHIEICGKRATVVGHGRLVGQPVSIWLMRMGAVVTVIAEPKNFDPVKIHDADIIVSGTGRTGLITGKIIKEGAIVIDVGSSQEDGAMKGDIDDESVSKKAAFFAPSRGGVGPLTVAFIFENLLKLSTPTGRQDRRP